MAKKKAVSPGEAIEARLAEYALTPEMLAKAIGEKPGVIKGIKVGVIDIYVELGLKLAKAFGDKETYWIDIQTAYDLAKADRQELLKDVQKVKKPASKPGRKPAVKKAAETADVPKKTRAARKPKEK